MVVPILENGSALYTWIKLFWSRLAHLFEGNRFWGRGDTCILRQEFFGFPRRKKFVGWKERKRPEGVALYNARVAGVRADTRNKVRGLMFFETCSVWWRRNILSCLAHVLVLLMFWGRDEGRGRSLPSFGFGTRRSVYDGERRIAEGSPYIEWASIARHKYQELLTLSWQGWPAVIFDFPDFSLLHG